MGEAKAPPAPPSARSLILVIFSSISTFTFVPISSCSWLTLTDEWSIVIVAQLVRRSTNIVANATFIYIYGIGRKVWKNDWRFFLQTSCWQSERLKRNQQTQVQEQRRSAWTKKFTLKDELQEFWTPMWGTSSAKAQQEDMEAALKQHALFPGIIYSRGWLFLFFAQKRDDYSREGNYFKYYLQEVRPIK